VSVLQDGQKNRLKVCSCLHSYTVALFIFINLALLSGCATKEKINHVMRGIGEHRVEVHIIEKEESLTWYVTQRGELISTYFYDNNYEDVLTELASLMKTLKGASLWTVIIENTESKYKGARKYFMKSLLNQKKPITFIGPSGNILESNCFLGDTDHLRYSGRK
jgi:hypothetical protein